MRTTIRGPFELARQSAFFGGWTRAAGDGIVMAFPVEGGGESAAVLLRQRGDTVEGQVYGGPDTAWAQALAVLSLDVDGSGFPAVGDRDPVLGALLREHGHPRPVLFHSPYEAACSFVLGHRLRIAQGRAIRAGLAREHGAAFEVDGTVVHAFPGPRRLLAVTAIPGVPPEKIDRMHGVAAAALDGLLDRDRLRALPLDTALAEVRTLRGVGPLFATGIVLRGAGLVDEMPGDEVTRAGIARVYGELSAAELERITAGWRPYRMWCSVLLHALQRRLAGAGAARARR